MVKYYNSMVVFEEVPNEITLAINITNCPCRCPGCHSKFLWPDVGTELTSKELERLIKINDGITCVCFMGHGSIRNIDYMCELSIWLKNKYNLKTALYTGFTRIISKTIVKTFDYIKEGKFVENLGPINNENTNQRFYINENGHFNDKTYLFWKRCCLIENYPYVVLYSGKIYSLTNHVFIKPFLNKKGYCRVKLYDNNKKNKTFFLHRIVAKYFLKNFNEQLQINHKDENKLNNSADNLEVCNSFYNNNYGNRNKNAAKSNKIANKRKHVLQISLNGELINKFNSAVLAAEHVNGSATLIRDCCNGGRFMKSRNKFVKISQAYGFKWSYE